MHKLQSQLALDAAQVWNPRQILGLTAFAVAFLLLGGHESGAHMATTVFSMISLLAATCPFIADQTFNLDSLYAQLPTNRTTVVRSHYLVGLAAYLVAAPVAAAFAWAITPDHSAGAILAMQIISISAAITALAIPAIVRFGQQALLFVTFGVAGGAFVGIKLLFDQQTLLELFEFIRNHPIPIALFLIGAVILIWFVSYAVTVTMYKRKNF